MQNGTKNFSSDIEDELGKNFLKSCGQSHPLYQKLMFTSCAEWLAAMQKLKTLNCNYAYLISKLYSRKKAYEEGIPFVEIAARHLREDFFIYFPDERQDQKNPDIELSYTPTGEKVYIEVTRISEGDLQERKNAFYDRLLGYCLHDGYSLPVRGKLFELPAESYLKYIRETIRDLKCQALTRPGIACYTDSYLAIAFADGDAIKELDQWCDESGIARRFDGFDVRFDYTKRIISTSRLRREAKQIPAGEAGLIYCPVHVLYMLTMDVAETIAAFALELVKYPQVFAVVFYAEVIPAPVKPFLISEADFVYAMQENKAQVARYTLMVKNPTFALPLSDGAKAALSRAAV